MSEPYLQNSIGIEGQDGVVIRILSQGVLLPSAVAYIFARARPEQSFIDLHLVKGDSNLVNQCVSLGVYRLFFQKKGIVEDSNLVVTFAANSFGEVFLFGKGLDTRLELTIEKQ